MVTIDESKPRGLAPPFFQRILKMAWFHILILFLVLANAIFVATMHFDHRTIAINGYYYAEVKHQFFVWAFSSAGDTGSIICFLYGWWTAASVLEQHKVSC